MNQSLTSLLGKKIKRLFPLENVFSYTLLRNSELIKGGSPVQDSHLLVRVENSYKECLLFWRTCPALHRRPLDLHWHCIMLHSHCSGAERKLNTYCLVSPQLELFTVGSTLLSAYYWGTVITGRSVQSGEPLKGQIQ